jgi:prevent-host-death family protein
VDVSVTAAKAQLTELVRRAEEGEDVVLTRHGQPVARLSAVRRLPTREEKLALMEEIMAAAPKDYTGPSAARSQDFLYDEDGLPG